MGGQPSPQPDRNHRASPIRRRGAAVRHRPQRRRRATISIDLPQKSDAAAIARCFLEVYGHHYVHSGGVLDPPLLGQGRERRTSSGGGARRRRRGHRSCRARARAWCGRRRTRRGGRAVGLPRPSPARAHDRAAFRGSAPARPARHLRRAAHHPHVLAAQRRARRHAGLRRAARRQSGELPAQGHPLPHRRTAPKLSAHLPLRAAARRAHDPRTRALSRDAAQDLREPRRQRVGRRSGGRGRRPIAAPASRSTTAATA